jgi:hypothetical protein
MHPVSLGSLQGTIVESLLNRKGQVQLSGLSFSPPLRVLTEEAGQFHLTDG